MKIFLIIPVILVTHFCFGQTPKIYTFKLLRLKDDSKLTYAVKAKEFHNAVSFRDSAITTFQTNKRAYWIVPVGMGYYDWEGFAHYNDEQDTIELWEAKENTLINYTSFIDLNNDKKLDIIFSNIYDQFLKTQSNWTDIYFNIKGKYIPMMLKGYLISLIKKNETTLVVETVEQPVNKSKSQFILHTYEVDTRKRTEKETKLKSIDRHLVKQSE